MTEKDLQHTDPVKLFKYLYRHSRPIRKWIRANNGSRSDAEDTLQDAMISFYQFINRPGFKLNVKPETLLFAIAKRIWLYQLRKMRNMPVSEMMDNMEADQTGELDIETEVKYRSMEKALVMMGEKCRELLELFYFKKTDMVKIAEVMGFRNDKVAKAMKYKCLEKARILITAKQ